MFTRRVIMKIKPGSAAQLARVIGSEVAPLLRRQQGMRYEDTFITPAISEAVSNSYWDTEGYADAYGRTGYPGALKALSGVVEGTPQVETFEVSSATFHILTANRREACKASRLGRGAGASTPLAHYPKLRQGGTALVSCNINERRVGGVTVLDVDGEIRAGGSRAALHEAVGRLLKEGRNQILLNLAGLSGIDAGGLGELLLSHVDLNKGGGQLKLLRPRRALREMMTITQLLTVFDIYESEAEALAGFAKPVLDLEGHLLSYEDARYEKHP